MADLNDILDDDIPVVDRTGNKRLVQGAGFADAAKPAPQAPAPQQLQRGSAPAPSSAPAAQPEPPVSVTAAAPAPVPAPVAAESAPAAPQPEFVPSPLLEQAAAAAKSHTADAPVTLADLQSAPAVAQESAGPAPSNLPFVDEAPFYANKSKALAAMFAPTPAFPSVKPAPKITPPPVAPAKAAPAASRADLGLEPQKDSGDIKKIEAQPVVQEMAAEQKQELTQLERAVEDAVIATAGTVKDEDARRRYTMLVSLFFRGLRDGLETKSKFTMPAVSGGMGFKDEEADQRMADLTLRAKAYNDTLRGQAAESKSAYVAERTEKVLNRQDVTDRREQEKGDRAYAGLLERVGMRGEEDPAPAAPMPPRVIPVTAGQAAAASAAPAVSVAVKSPAKSVAAEAPTVVPAAGTPAPLMQPVTAARPVVADVSYVPRLVGPVDELRTLTLKDFRRLSKDPAEAALKVKDKIDLLEEQSFTLKSQGITAWQGSEVNRLYLEVLRLSLEGKPVNEVIEEREKANLPTVSQKEFEAVMDLNRKLRFG